MNWVDINIQKPDLNRPFLVTDGITITIADIGMLLLYNSNGHYFAHINPTATHFMYLDEIRLPDGNKGKAQHNEFAITDDGTVRVISFRPKKSFI
jgi:hypothetical protein